MGLGRYAKANQKVNEISFTFDQSQTKFEKFLQLSDRRVLTDKGCVESVPFFDIAPFIS